MFTTSLHEITTARQPLGYGGCFYGVYTALVTDVADPDGQGRVRIRLPWSPDAGGTSFEAWARLATLMAGAERGSWFVPDPDDEVLVAFEAGDPRRPYVVGALWNGQDAPPETMDGAGQNHRKMLRSRGGVSVVLDDTPGQENLTLETPAGQSLILKDGPGSIEIQDAAGNVIKLEPGGISVQAAAKVTVQASALELKAASIKVDAGMVQFSGVIQASTVITQSVVSTSYSPGAGNTL